MESLNKDSEGTGAVAGCFVFGVGWQETLSSVTLGNWHKFPEL